jgi:hypothetical protein
VSTDFRTKIPSRGVHASRPDPADAVLYSCSDHGLVYRSDGSTWADWLILGTAPGGGGGSELEGVFFVDSASNFLSSADTSLSVDTPAGVADGDLLIAQVAIFDRASITATGWTAVPSRQEGSSGGAYQHLYYKIALSEGASQSFSWASARYAAAIVTVWRGQNIADPLSDSTSTIASNVTITAPTLTPDATCRCLIFFGAIRTDTRTITNWPMCPRVVNVASSGGTTNGVMCCQIDQTWNGVTATGARSVTASGTTSFHSNVGVLLGINAEPV